MSIPQYWRIWTVIGYRRVLIVARFAGAVIRTVTLVLVPFAMKVPGVLTIVACTPRANTS